MDIFSQTVAERALSAGVAQTVVQLLTASAGPRAQITSLTVSFTGTSSTAEPVDVFLVTQDTAGTSSGGTVAKLDPSAPTALTTTRVTFTAEPTTDSNEVWRTQIHPQGGLYEKNWALGDPTAPKIVANTRLGLKMRAEAAVNATVTIQWVE